MEGRPSPTFLGATILAAILAIAGAWLPWVRKRPVGTIDGQPYYTAEYVSGLETGLRGIDPVVVAFVTGVAGVAVLARRQGWRPDGVLIIVGGLMLLIFGNIFYDYWMVERYAIEPGLYLLLVSGLVFLLLGVRTPLKRSFTPLAVEDGVDSQSR